MHMLNFALNPLFLKALVGVALASLMSMIGAIALLRGVAYLPAEVSHSALGGAAVGVLLSAYVSPAFEPFLMAIAFSVATALLTEYAGRKEGPEMMGAAIGGALAITMSIYALIRGIVPGELKAIIDGYLIGDLLLLSISDLVELASVAALVLFFLTTFYSEFVYLCFDMDGAEALGINVKLYDALLFGLTGLAGVVATKAIGALLVYAFIIAPAAAAKELASSVRLHLTLTFAIALSSGILGLGLSIMLNLPASGVVAAIPSAFYITSLTFKFFRK